MGTHCQSTFHSEHQEVACPLFVNGNLRGERACLTVKREWPPLPQLRTSSAEELVGLVGLEMRAGRGGFAGWTGGAPSAARSNGKQVVVLLCDL